jgi:hypothetical protein
VRTESRSRLFPAVWATATGLALAAAAADLVEFAVAHRVSPAFDLDRHASLFGGVSLLALAVACVAAQVAAILAPERRGRSALLAVLLAAVLALRIDHPARVLVLSIPLLAAVFVALWQYAPDGSGRRLLRAACIVLAVAYAAHAVDTWFLTGSPLASDPARWGEQIVSAIKHGTELAGWALAAGGLIVLWGAAAPAIRPASSRRPASSGHRTGPRQAPPGGDRATRRDDT